MLQELTGSHTKEQLNKRNRWDLLLGVHLVSGVT